jgi:hypothetical protein
MVVKRKKEKGLWKEPEDALPDINKCIPTAEPPAPTAAEPAPTVPEESPAPVPPVVVDTPEVVPPKEKRRRRDPYAEAGCIIV